MENDQQSYIEEHEIEWDNNKISNLWNYYAKTHPYCDIYFANVFGEYILRRSGLPFKEELAILDFGCGPGYLWDHLCNLKIPWDYTGIDFSKESIEIIKKKAKGHPRFNSAIFTQSLPIDLPEAIFDAVFLVEVFEHLPDEYLNNILRETYRLLKTNGVVVITTPNKEDLSLLKRFCPECGAIFHQWQHIRNWDKNSLTKYLGKYYFYPVKIQTLDFSTEGINAKSIFKNIYICIKQYILRKNYNHPHMIAVYKKISC